MTAAFSSSPDAAAAPRPGRRTGHRPDRRAGRRRESMPPRRRGPVVARSDAGGTFALPWEDQAPADGLRRRRPGFAAERISAATLGAGGSITVVLRPAALAETVTVTAGRRELRGVDTPAATTVVSSADLLRARRHHGRRCAALHAGLHVPPAVLVPRRQPDDAGRHAARPLGVRRQPHAGARRRRAAQRSRSAAGSTGCRVPQAAIDRIEIVRGAHQRSLRRRRRRRRDPGRAADVRDRAPGSSVEGGSLGPRARVRLFGGAHAAGSASASPSSGSRPTAPIMRDESAAA